MTRAKDIATLLSTANGKIAGNNLDVSFENITDTGTEGTRVATGTNAQRGTTQGQLRFNTDTGLAEYYTGTAFKTIDSPPTISSISPTTATAGNTSITITGSNFQSGATVKFIGNDGTEYTSPSVTVNSDLQITATTPASAFTVANEPYDIKVTNSSGLSTTLADALDAGGSPTWNTASGSIGSVDEGASASFSISATDPDGQAIIYSETGGTNLSSNGFTLNSSTGAITGTAPSVSSATTISFTGRASDGTNTSDRAFNFVVNNLIALPSDISSWTYPVDETHSSGTFNTTNYYGYGFSVKNGDGRIAQDYGSYEYPIFSKYSVRSSVNEDVIIQLYNLSAYNTGINLLQFGAIWTNPTAMAGTNTLMATTDLADGDGVYLVNGGYQPSGTFTTGFFKGGSNHNAVGQGSSNRESQLNLSYSANTISFVIKKDTGTNARKIAVYSGDTKWYTYTQQIPSSTSNIYWYVGHGYSQIAGAINNLLPKLRYSASTNYNFTV